MHFIQVIMIMSFTTMLLVTALLLIIRSMPSRPGLKWWMGASMIQALIFFMAIQFFESKPDITGVIVFYCLAMTAALSLSIGTMLFANIPLNINRRIVALMFTVLGIVALVKFDYLFLASVCFAVFNAGFLFHTAYKIFNVKFGKINFKIPSILLTIQAFHWLDFPVLSQVEWFAPYGVVIGMILLAAIFINLSVCVLLQFIEQTQDSERRAVKEATYDSLTGLYNRSQLNALFNNYVKEAKQLDRSFILLYFDLDGFKHVNDTYGHKAGDLILKTVTERISKYLGSKGDGIRIGGDELVVLTRMSDVYCRKKSLLAAEKLLDIIKQPIVDDNEIYQISASIGGCCYGQPHTDLDNMLNKSDTLMYAAKQAGGKRIYFSHSAVMLDNKLESASQRLAM